MEEKLKSALAEVVFAINGSKPTIELDYPDEQFGDFTSNIALKLAKLEQANPLIVAKSIADSLKQKLSKEVKKVEVAGPGFINVTLSDEQLLKEMEKEQDRPLSDQVAVVEFSDPNPFKILHAGHLYTSIVGDAIANLLSSSGAKVFRVNYGGDVGLHVAKSMWAMLQKLGGVKPEKLEEISKSERVSWMSQAYVEGNTAYDQDKQFKQEIEELNKQIYQIQDSDDHKSSLAKIYWITRGWSYDEFDRFYSMLNIFFDKYYPESETAPVGLKIVEKQLERGVFEKSDGAVVFRGDKFGLHTRVFINSKGLPTYETKDIGLMELKKQDFNYDRSIIITGSEQEQYMSVVVKAVEQFAPELVKNTKHLTHGMVRMEGGKKMSSRLGNILKAEDILHAADEAIAAEDLKSDSKTLLAAVKYAFLKNRLGPDVIYNPKESVNVLGNSGPYLQYAHARARSILAKTGEPKQHKEQTLNAEERHLALKLSRFSSIVSQAAATLSPHLLCTYLYDLSQVFNQFYESNRVVGSDREGLRAYLTSVYADRLQNGLNLLGIDAPKSVSKK